MPNKCVECRERMSHCGDGGIAGIFKDRLHSQASGHAYTASTVCWVSYVGDVFKAPKIGADTLLPTGHWPTTGGRSIFQKFDWLVVVSLQ